MKRRLRMFLLSISIGLLIFGCAKHEDLPTVTEESAVSADGVSIRYHVRGKGAPALVFVHGWCCDGSYWDSQVSFFARNHTVVTVDLAGHGDSGLDRKAWTIAAFGEDVAAVVQKLDLDRVILLGHSLGGFVILEAARLMPDRVVGLVGVDTLNDFEYKFTQEAIDRILPPFHSDFAEAVGNFVGDMFTPTTDPALVQKIVDDMASAPPHVGVGAMEAFVDFQNNHIIQAAHDVHVPITCINSDKYPTNLEGNQRIAPSYKLVRMSGVGHFVMIEDPETFNRLLEEVVQEFIQINK